MLSPADRLREEISTIPAMEEVGYSPSERVWREHVNMIRNYALRDDPNTFLTWPPIISTMAAAGHEDWSGISRAYLESLPDWETRWKPVMTELPTGTPTYHGTSPPTSSALVIATHCAALLEQKMNVKISDLSLIVEFGGGYGCMCRVLYGLGFQGTYINFELPMMAALMRYYLAEIGLSDKSILYSSDIAQLSGLLEQHQDENSLFTSAWALSESPLSLRSQLLPLLKQFRYLYLIYQPRFREVDNQDFFARLPLAVGNMSWQTWSIEHLGATALAGVSTH